MTFSIAAACAAAAISQVGFFGLMSGAFLSVVMLVGAMLQTAAACRAAATGRFLFSSSDFFLLFAGYGILEAAWLCVCFALMSEGNKVLQLMDPALFAQFGILGVLSSVQRGMLEFPVDAVLAVVVGAVVARQAALLGESQHAVAEFVEVRQQAAAARRCHIAFWAKATLRVDVGDTPNTMVTASSRCGLWLGNLENVGKEEREKEKVKDEEKEEVPLVHTLCSSCPVFLRTLSGRTIVMTVGDCSTSELLQRIEEVTQIPQQHWYCHVNGSPLPHGNAPHGLHRDCTVVMCARLKGGAPTIPGEWFCQVCQRGGCWPARTHCFRCGCKKGEKTFRGPPPGNCFMSHGTSAAPQQGSRKPPNTKLSQQVVLEALRSVGLPLELMQQLQATLAPPALPEIPAKRLLDLQIKLDRVQKERDRLASVHQRKQEEMMQAELRLDNRKTEVQEVLAAIDRVKMEMDIPSPAVPLVQEPGEVDEVESPAFDGMDDDAFLGLNHHNTFPIWTV